MKAYILQYYGIDWVGTVLMLAFLIAIGSKRRGGFIFGMIGNLFWFIFGIQTNSVASLVLCSIQFFLNLRAYLLWSSKPAFPPINRKEVLMLENKKLRYRNFDYN